MTDQAAEGALPRFDRSLFDGKEPATRMGDGPVGGKAAGLIRIRDTLASAFPGASPDVEVSIPTMSVVTAERFDRFMEENRLEEVALSGESDDAIARAFQKGGLPADLVGDLRALADHIHAPLAVRSSSLLEDALERPFAGVYATKMIPNNQLGPDERFRKLAEAVKLVWASTYFRGAKSYRLTVDAGRLLAGGQERLHGAVQRILVVDEQRSEGQDARAVHSGSRHEPVRGGVPGGSGEEKRSVRLGLHERRFHEVLGLANGVVRRGLPHVHGPELGLRALEEFGCGRKGRGRPRVGWRIDPGDPAVHDRLSEAESEENDAVLGASGAEAVEAV